MSGTCIADHADVAFSEVYHIIRGDRTYVLSDVARKILAVEPVPMFEWSPGRQVPSIGSARRIQALVALGHTQADLAAEIGCYENRIPRMMRQPFVTVAFARDVDALYRRLMFTPAPDTLAARRSRQRAQRAGWWPPLAWEDIDDPAEKPERKLRYRANSVAPFDDRYQDVVAIGVRGDANIAERLGISEVSLRTMRSRAGLAVPA
ncbi:hypothetical protein [Mycolicibacterium llatzerense]|uniref:Uncharacterized protein n=1 Tax=Mycolicibacterium llatzerense TaxID=280871 RepID=A0A0D1LHE5_9MYCO|nr:hypothetical protein [Mycolicibacterium llatzerense]KIU17882.1 hypothetical protein TL10_06390 [Mycolicibacterium llatzerense]